MKYIIRDIELAPIAVSVGARNGSTKSMLKKISMKLPGRLNENKNCMKNYT
jgi:hypothetical protein